MAPASPFGFRQNDYTLLLMTISNNEILVIDDELQIRKLLQITLQSNGFQVLQAGTAKENSTATQFWIVTLPMRTVMTHFEN